MTLQPDMPIDRLWTYLPPTGGQVIPTFDMSFDDGARTVTVSVPVEASEDVRRLAVDAFYGAIDRLRPAHPTDPMDDLPDSEPPATIDDWRAAAQEGDR